MEHESPLNPHSQANSHSQSDPQEDDRPRFKIGIFTDNHLGYKHKDPVRGQDSFAAFEECLWRCQQENVDFVIQAGD
jgi:double-strand break repair protein MRE11